MPLTKNQIIPLSIASIASDGSGVGRFEGEAVFVPAAAVGDSLRVRIVKAAKRYAYGRIEQIVTPGPGRRAEDCPVSRSCGGCCFRHLTYEAELAAKQGFVEDALRRLGGLSVPVLPILPSPQENRYRNKVQYPVAGSAAGLTYGFFAPRSHRVVPCEDCLLQPRAMNEVAARTAALLRGHGAHPYDEQARTGQVRHIYLRQNAAGTEVMVCIVAAGGNLPGRAAIAAALAEEFPQVKTVVLNLNQADTNVILGEENIPLLGSGTIEDELCGVPLHLAPHSFSQVNSAGAQQLFGVAQEYAAVQGGTLLDLYCGTGVIGLSMARAAARLIGVEIVPQAVEAARRSAAEMGLANAYFYCEDAGAAARRLAAAGEKPQVITVDPPRKGCDEATLGAMVAMAPQRIVMVSCNPATLARDLAWLTARGYAATRVQPVDMFPRTKHVECVALLEKPAP